MAKRNSQATKEKAVALREQGLSYSAIGLKLGAHASSVELWVNPKVAEKRRHRSQETSAAAKRTGKPLNTRYSEEDKQEARRLYYEDGLSLRAVADRLGAAHTTVGTWVDEDRRKKHVAQSQVWAAARRRELGLRLDREWKHKELGRSEGSVAEAALLLRKAMVALDAALPSANGAKHLVVDAMRAGYITEEATDRAIRAGAK